MSRRRVLRWVGATVLLVVAGLAVWMGVQALEVRRFKQVLLSCEIGSDRCGDAAWPWLETHSRNLGAGYRWDAESHELLARAHVLFSTRHSELGKQRAELKQALSAITRAIQLRPRWSYAHAARLGILLKLGDLDADADQAWRDCWRYGGNEKRVLRVLGEAVLTWRLMGRATPTDPQPILGRLAERDRPYLIDLAIRLQGRDILCDRGGVLSADPICQTSPAR